MKTKKRQPLRTLGKHIKWALLLVFALTCNLLPTEAFPEHSLHAGVASAAEPEVTDASAFSDIGDAAYREDIEYFADLGIISGDNDGKFLPDKTITRGEFAAIVNKIGKSDTEETQLQPIFRDVDKTRWAYDAVMTFVFNGVLSGFEDNTFRPEEEITTAQLIVICENLTGYSALANQTDGLWYEPYMEVAREYGILNGVNLLAEDVPTRAQAMKILHTTMDLPIAQTNGMIMGVDGMLHANVRFMDGSSEEQPLTTLATLFAEE